MNHDDRRPSAVGDAEALAGEPISVPLADLRERLRAAAPLVDGDDPTSAQWRLLRDASAERGRVFEYHAEGWVDARGGSEHLCRFHETIGRWEKSTHENGAGWWVDPDGRFCLPATPRQYLERLDLANQVFGDDIRFVGVDVGPTPHSCRIRTTQPHVPGNAPNQSTLEEWLVALGFERQQHLQIGAYDSLCFRRESLWLFDVRPMNFVEITSGELFAIDVIVQNFEADAGS